MRTTIAFLILTLCTLNARPVLASAPAFVPLQGVLTDADGDAIDADTSVRLRLYSAEIGGTALWDETQTVAVHNGFFSIYLGQVEPLYLELFRDQGDLWLGITVASDPEMDRVRLGSTPYSAYAEYCGHAPDHSHAMVDLTGSLPLGALPAGVPVGEQMCTGASKVSGISAGGMLMCSPDIDSDTDTTYDGDDFALSGQSCNVGDVVTGVDASGLAVCAPDQNNTYAAGDGLALTGDSFSVAPNGINSSMIQDGQVQNQDIQTVDWNKVTNKTSGRVGCYTTPYFSEEQPMFFCNAGYFVNGLECRDSYCDDIRMYCCKPF